MRTPLQTSVAVGFLLLWACGGKIKDDSSTISSSSSGSPVPTVTSTTPLPTTTTTSTSKPPVPPPPPDTDGVVACGDGNACFTGSSACCDTVNGESCLQKGADCNGSRAECDDSSDCPRSNRVCCMRPLQNGLRMSASCSSTCVLNSISFQACAGDLECEQPPCADHVCQGRAYRFCGPALEGYCEK